MTTQVLARTTKPSPPVGRWDRIAAWSLLFVVALTYVAAALVGERERDVSALRHEIGSGDVTEVRMSEALGGVGYGTVTVRWKEHGLRYVTTVTQASNEREARRATNQNPGGEVVVGDVAEALTTDGRTVTVTGSTAVGHGETRTSVAGFNTPVAFFWVRLGTLCATLFLIGAVEPWRATRWGWGWLVLLTPFGVPLFLLFGGLTGLFRPRAGARRLTGGWAFLAACVFGGALS